MAQMIPERLPARASRGEERLWEVLKKLDDECIVYYEPLVRDSYPDIVVLIPSVGVLVIEVKGWFPSAIISADREQVTVREAGAEVKHLHPEKQARGYMFKLMDEARRFSFARPLLHERGEKQGRFIFPFGHLAFLSNITQDQLERSEDQAMSRIFSGAGMITRDILDDWELLDGGPLLEALKAQFDRMWDIQPLNAAQVKALRAVIHPEVRITTAAATRSNSSGDGGGDGIDLLKVLDLQQEREARNIRSGHRIIYGVAGSGKTVVLVARAKLLAEDGNKRILVLCFNRALAAYLRASFAEKPNIRAVNFHRWGAGNNIKFEKDEPREDFGCRLLERFGRGEGDVGHFDAVLIDEYQDFARSWLKCARLALREPEDGDLLIVGDASQALDEIAGFTWREAGIRAQGRTTVLKTNYRNTREIITTIKGFAGNATTPDAEEPQVLPIPAPEACVRNGPPVRIIQCKDIFAEVETAAKLIRDWVHGAGIGGKRLLPNEIGVLYPRLETPLHRKALLTLRNNLKHIGSIQLSGQYSDGSITDPGIKISTIQGSKGLQFRALILIWADLLPAKFKNRVDTLERNQIYVALTRAEETVAIAHSGASRYVDELRENLGLSKAEARLGQPWLL